MKLDEKQLTELTTSYPYVCKDTVIEVIDKIDIDKISVQELYDMYLDYKNKYNPKTNPRPNLEKSEVAFMPNEYIMHQLKILKNVKVIFSTGVMLQTQKLINIYINFLHNFILIK